MGKTPPRASLQITILDDEDYHVLLALPGGFEAFGQFCSLLIVGRERLQQGKAVRVGETKALIFTNKLNHVLSRARMTRPQLDALLVNLRAVADEADSEPWLALNDESLIIRSFFKYHTPTDSGWGGTRNGAGRKVKNQDDSALVNQDDSLSGIKMIKINNQDDSENNQDDSHGIQDEKKHNHLEKNKESSCDHSVSNPVSNPVSDSIDRRALARSTTPENPGPPISHGSFQECLEEVLELFGDSVAENVRYDKRNIVTMITGPQGEIWWDALAAGFRDADRARRRVKDPVQLHHPLGWALKKAQEWTALGHIPADPIPADLIRMPPPDRPELRRNTVPSPDEINAKYLADKAERLAREAKHTREG